MPQLVSTSLRARLSFVLRCALLLCIFEVARHPDARASQVEWSTDNNGTWSNPANWSTGLVPQPADTVTISRPSANPVITFSTGTVSVMRVTSDETFQLTGGTLTVVGDITVNAPLTLSGGGTLTAATAFGAPLALAGGTLVSTVVGDLTYASSGGTLDAVTINGTLTPVGLGEPAITIMHGLILNGTADVGLAGQSSKLNFSGTQTLSGSGDVLLAASVSNGVVPVGGTLTIGPNIHVHGEKGSVGSVAQGLVNQGLIEVDVVGGQVTVTGAGWSNTGLLQADPGTTLNLGGTMTTAGLGTWTGANAIVNLVGSLNNQGSILALTAATGSLRLLAGSISGGTITGAGGAGLLYTVSNGTLDDVILDTDLAPVFSTGTPLVTIINGMTLNGVASVGGGGSPGRIDFSGSQLLDGTGSILFAGSPSNLVQPTGGTLTIGPGITLHGQAGTIGASTHALNCQGTISADGNGGTLRITGKDWVNTGLVQATNNATLELAGSVSASGLGDFRGTAGTVALVGTLKDSADTLALTATTGSLQLKGGTIEQGMVSASGGAVLSYTVFGGTLKNVVLDADLVPLGTTGTTLLTILNGMTLNGTVTLGTGTGNPSQLNFAGTQTLGGAGQILFANGAANALQPTTTGSVLTIGPGITIHGQTGRVGQSGWALLNQGNINADVSGGVITVTGTGWTNAGMMQASAGGATLALTGTGWTNAGTVQVATGATLNLGGTFVTTGLGTWLGSAGTVNLSGTLDNRGRTLLMDGTTGSLRLFGGTILGGTVTATGGAMLLYTTSGGTLNGVTLNAELAPTGSSGTPFVTVSGGMTLNGILYVGAGTLAARVDCAGIQAIGGTGQILFANSTSNLLRPTSGVLTIGPSITTHGTNGTLGDAGFTLLNQGTLNADNAGGTLTLTGSSWVNTGLIEGTNGGTLRLAGSFSTAGLGDFRGTSGTVNIVGALNNAGDTLALNATTGSPHLFGGSVSGGSIAGSGGAVLLYTSSGGTLSEVTLNVDAAPFVSTGTPFLTITNGIMVNGVVSVGNGGTASRVDFSGTQTLAGAGSFLLSSASSNLVQPTGGVLTIGAGITLHGQAGTIGAAAYGLVNQGTVDADVTGGTLTLTGSGWTNQGVLEATNAATLNLAGTVATAGLGNFQGTAGNVNLTGTLNNVAATLNLTPTTGSLRLVGGTIVGGTITGAGGAVLLYTTSGGTLNGVTLDADLTPFTSTGTPFLTITGGLTLNGLASVGSGGSPSRIDFSGSQSLTGAGSILFSSAPSNVVQPTSGTLTVGVGMRLHGQAGTIGSATAPLVNQGTIDSDVPGGTLTITGAGWVNSGLIQATNGASLNLAGAFSTSGLGDFRGTAGNVNITGTLNNSAGPLLLTATTGSPRLAGGTIVGGTIATGGGVPLLFTNSGGTLNGVTMNADLVPTGSGTPFATVSGGLTLNGTVYLGLGTTSARLDFSGSQTLGGTGDVLLANSGSNLIRPTSGTLTIGTGLRVHGQAGTVGSNTMPTINNGAVSADLAGSVITLAGTDWFNQGRVTASGGNLTASGAFWNAESVLVGAGRIFTASVAYTQTAGQTLLQKGTLSSSFPVEIAGGQLSGAGTVAGSLELHGVLSPGVSPDTLLITGDYVQSDAATLVVDVAGPAPGVGYDVVRVSGDATLAGRLQVRLGNGFIPANGDSFLVMTYASRSGTFGQLDLPWLLPSSAWQVFYGNSYLALRVVPPGEVGTVEETPDAPGTAPPAIFALHAGTPNPFRTSTQIRYDLPVAGRVTLAIFDISGRRLVSLLDDALRPAGRQVLTWDGRDGSGRALPQGIYFCRCDASGHTASQRIVRLR